jgi:isopentenyldiphosphate isomerase
MIENEIDHVYGGKYRGGAIHFNRDEIDEVKWVQMHDLKKALLQEDDYAYWFRLIVEEMESHLDLP